MHIAFNFCKHAMATCFAELSKDELSELSGLIEGKKRGKYKTKLYK